MASRREHCPSMPPSPVVVTLMFVADALGIRMRNEAIRITARTTAESNRLLPFASEVCVLPSRSCIIYDHPFPKSGRYQNDRPPKPQSNLVKEDEPLKGV